ncbi:MAG TPA: hypothetical protein VK324_11085 [Tepidisphaeraceae bacterium]|nr:hypothetical protein [Tepidisphaeraceae bacterium]
MVLSLSKEIEERVRARAAARGVPPEVIVTEAIEATLAVEPAPAAPEQTQGPVDPNSVPHEQWSKMLRDWAASHDPLPEGCTVDDSRESIYEGR